MSKILHTYTKPKTELFWMVVYSTTLIAGACTGVFLAALPVYLYFHYLADWLLILGVFIPIGLWIIWATLRNLRKLLWFERHPPTFVLCNEKIKATEWSEPFSKSPVERVISLPNITSVIASFYIIRETYNVSDFKGKITENGPILYILYEEEEKQKVLNIPFPNHEYPGINIWLSHFQQRGIPLQYTPRQLYRLDSRFPNDKQRIAYFNQGGELVKLPFRGSWITDEASARESWIKKGTDSRQ